MYLNIFRGYQHASRICFNYGRQQVPVLYQGDGGKGPKKDG